MPELPEVETVRRGLRPALKGRSVAEARAYVDKLRLPVPTDFSKRLEGQVIRDVLRRAKYLLLDCESGLQVIWHLGMSGRVSVLGHNRAAGWQRQKHDHITIATDRGDLVVFNDARRFGLITLCDREDLADHPLLRDIGPEPVPGGFDPAALADSGPDTPFDAAVLTRALAGRNTPVKAALLDQGVVAGVGNIYACEALHRAGISPRRKARTIAGGRAVRLASAVTTVLEEAIESGGSTLRDHAQVSGDMGYFQHSFQVYGREGEPCLRGSCGGTVRRLVQAGRSTFYCPGCQR